MIAVLAPSKTMDFTSDIKRLKLEKQPLFKEKTASLVNHLKSKSIEDLMELMKISKNIAEENYHRYRDFSFGTISERQRPAIFALQGDVYKGLNAVSFNEREIIVAEASIRILSGLYGILSPLTLIEPYRFEMGLKFNGIKASGYWKDSVTEELNRLLAKSKNRIIINLASAEYMAAIDKKKLDGKIIDIVFRENRNGQLKTIAIFAKRARGMMARYIVKEKIESPEELKAFNHEGYCYEDSLSKENSLVFLR